MTGDEYEQLRYLAESAMTPEGIKRWVDILEKRLNEK